MQSLADVRLEVAMQGDWFVVVAANVVNPRAFPDDERTEFSEQLRVCGNDADGAPACTDSMQIGSVVHVETGNVEPPGNDGIDIHDEVRWRLRYAVSGDVLTIALDTGKPDAAAAKLLGRHRLQR
jgi:hypothetical protein